MFLVLIFTKMLNSVDRITDRYDMTSAVYRGRKASTQANKLNFLSYKFIQFMSKRIRYNIWQLLFQYHHPDYQKTSFVLMDFSFGNL